MMVPLWLSFKKCPFPLVSFLSLKSLLPINRNYTPRNPRQVYGRLWKQNTVIKIRFSYRLDLVSSLPRAPFSSASLFLLQPVVGDHLVLI